MTVLPFEKCEGSAQIGYDLDGDINNSKKYTDIRGILAKFEPLEPASQKPHWHIVPLFTYE